MKTRTAWIAAFASGWIAVTHTLAAPIPSHWDFGSDAGKDSGSEFTFSSPGTSTWSLQSDALRFTGQSSGGQSGAATTTFTDLSSGSGFTISAEVTPSYQYWDTLEILALGNAAAAGQSSSTINFNGIAARFNNNNGTRLLQLLRREGTTTTTLASSSWTLGAGVQTFVLDVAFIGADLQLDLKVTNASSVSQTLSHTIVNHDLTGAREWAGFGGYIAGGSRSLNFDTFSVIPEPSTALLALAAGGLLLLRRRHGWNA